MRQGAVGQGMDTQGILSSSLSFKKLKKRGGGVRYGLAGQGEVRQG